MKTLVCFGDSITADEQSPDGSLRLTPRLRKELIGWNVINAGVPAETTRAAIKRLQSDVLDQEPHCVTILFGANDASDHRLVPLEEYGEHLAFMIEKIGPEKVVLISPAPVDERQQNARSNERMEKYRNKSAELARSYGTGFLDLWSIMNNTSYKELLEEDGLHFNEKAYVLFSNELLKILKQWQ
ncbi:GDSL-type esterase/lipase family protein [Fictibacillus aquaticus]|uniref:SGNH hydrolase-type esterase domain-containing protein n=1 Tax=Fictibacillus aquaticus TaxID=2021314 RepID=A0A235FCX8_9BACL|nr:GDSL-type esterase/lipase family protein [Fictibacillus aquaticus]OYD59092.1 hypothetical protein CGZ90_04095 [Fictibacillus aquaticus]